MQSKICFSKKLTVVILSIAVGALLLSYLSESLLTNKQSLNSKAAPPRTLKQKPQPMVGGNEAPPGKWPYIASIGVKITSSPTPTGGPFYEVKCVGTVISPHWILTESNCVKNMPNKTSIASEQVSGTFKTAIANFNFPLGKKVFFDIDSRSIFISIGQYPGKQFPTVGAGTPPIAPNQDNYADFAVINENGIALLHVASPITILKYTRLLAADTTVKTGDMGVILGIKDLIKNRTAHQGILPILLLNEQYQYVDYIKNLSFISAGYFKSQDVYTDEPGSPLFIFTSGTSQSKFWYQIGVFTKNLNGLRYVNQFLNFGYGYKELTKTDGLLTCTTNSQCSTPVTYLDWIVAVDNAFGTDGIQTGYYPSNTNLISLGDSAIDSNDSGLIKYSSRKCEAMEYAANSFVPAKCPTPTPTIIK